MTPKIDLQLLFNIALSLVGFFGAWILKRAFETLDKQDAKIDDIKQSIHNIQVFLPSKYVNKEDLNTFTEQINARFDKIDGKLDNIIERGS